MRLLILILFLLPFISNAQQETGVHFEENTTWSNVLAKAKAENKNIFVDCYASWCGPCKMMDKEVYSIDSSALVGLPLLTITD